jgi:hypothetical protein
MAGVGPGDQGEPAVVPAVGAAVDGDRRHSPCGQEARSHPAAMTGGADDVHLTSVGELPRPPGQLGERKRARPRHMPPFVLVRLAHVDNKASPAVQLGELVDGDRGHGPVAEDSEHTLWSIFELRSLEATGGHERRTEVAARGQICR